MATEVEVRLLDIDVADLHTRLREAGALIRSSVLLREVRFAGLSGRDEEYVRVRADGDQVLLQHKCHAGDGVSATEHEIATDDFDAAVRFLAQLGLRRLGLIERRRTRYALGCAVIAIDKFPGIAPHVEVEAEHIADVVAACAQLGLDASRHFAGGILDIYHARGVFPECGSDLVFTDEERRQVLEAVQRTSGRSAHGRKEARG